MIKLPQWGISHDDLQFYPEEFGPNGIVVLHVQYLITFNPSESLFIYQVRSLFTILFYGES